MPAPVFGTCSTWTVTAAAATATFDVPVHQRLRLGETVQYGSRIALWLTTDVAITLTQEVSIDAGVTFVDMIAARILQPNTTHGFNFVARGDVYRIVLTRISADASGSIDVGIR